MRILFIGGTGLISTACSAATVAAGHELWLMNRGHVTAPDRRRSRARDDR